MRVARRFQQGFEVTQGQQLACLSLLFVSRRKCNHHSERRGERCNVSHRNSGQFTVLRFFLLLFTPRRSQVRTLYRPLVKPLNNKHLRVCLKSVKILKKWYLPLFARFFLKHWFLRGYLFMRLPKMTLHKPSGNARVRILGKDYYLGKWNSPDAIREYKKIIKSSLNMLLAHLLQRRLIHLSSLEN